MTALRAQVPVIVWGGPVAPATVTLGNLSATYDGTQKSATATRPVIASGRTRQRNQRNSSGQPIAESTWIGDYADPLTFLQLWTSGSNLNDARFSDKEYDTAVNEAIELRPR